MARRAATTTFVGRERDRSALAARFAAGERVVTLLGPGGIGKTRLALKFAEESSPSVFCDLVDAKSATDVALAACRALGVRAGADDVGDQVGRALAERADCLVVLDNLDDIVPLVRPLLEQWLVLAPRARFLATSRVALRLPDEVVHELGPLLVPRTPAELATSEAAALWVDRVTRARGDYDLTQDDATSVTELLRRLDGHPLAIELAASRSRMLQAKDLLARLEDRFALLAAEGRTWDSRHATLLAVIASSWDALAEPERSALARLTVLGAEFPIDAAEAVLGARALDTIDLLRDRALLTAPAPGRLGMYEGIREFAAARLDPADRAQAVRAHAAAFADRARRWLHSHPATPEARDVRDAEVAAERGNLLAVAERAIAGEAPASDAVYCVAAADVLHPVRDPGSRFVSVLDDVTTRAIGEDAEGIAAGWAAYLRGSASRRVGRFAEARPLLERAIALAKAHADRDLEAEARVTLGTVHMLEGHLDAAEDEVALVTASAGASVRGRAYTLLGQVRAAQHRLREARVALERAIEWLAAAAPAELAFGHLNLAETYMDLGELDEGKRAIERAAEIQRKLGDRRLAASVANMAGWHAVHRADYDAAVKLYEDASASLEGSFGAETFAAHLLGWAGLAHFLAGRYEAAAMVLGPAVERVRAIESRAAMAYVLAAARVLAGRTTVEEWTRETAAAGSTTERGRRIAAMLAAIVGLAGAGGGDLAATLAAADTEVARAREGSIERFLVRHLEELRRARSGDAPVLRVARDGSSFAIDGQAVVDLSAQPLLAKLLAELAGLHASERGATRSIEALFALGWPGERAAASSVEDRVRAVVKRLRKLGLGDVLETKDGGFRIAPRARVTIG